MLVTAANTLVRIFLEPLCAACAAVLDRPLASPVCDTCWRAVARLTPPCCVRCGDALAAWRAADPLCARCRRQPPIFSLARSAGRYDGSLRQIIHVFKYGRRRLLAAPLGALMVRAGPDILAGADAVIPVPLHPLRAWQRGFNQSDDLARALGLPVWRVLRRCRHGPPQAGLAGRSPSRQRARLLCPRAVAQLARPSPPSLGHRRARGRRDDDGRDDGGVRAGPESRRGQERSSLDGRARRRRRLGIGSRVVGCSIPEVLSLLSCRS